MKKTNRGFSLLELLIVVAIILVIATIAIPSLLKSRQQAQETAAVSNLKALNAAQVAYLSTSGGLYGDIAALIAAEIIDETFDTSKTPKQGYNYSVVLTGSPAGAGYSAFANRSSSNSGRYSYYSTPEGLIRFSTVPAEAPAGRNGKAVN
jgi:prepilin-type N-terminal cleavage/methylation domain-containing protein